MKTNLLIVLFSIISLMTFSQTYEIISVSSSTSEVDGKNLGHIHDGDDGTYWQSNFNTGFSRKDLTDKKIQLHYTSNQPIIDEIYVYRQNGTIASALHHKVAFNIYYYDGSDWHHAGGKDEGWSGREVYKNINEKVSILEIKYNGSLKASHRTGFNELQARRYHRLTINVDKNQNWLTATHNNITNPLTILSTQAAVNYKATISGVNHKFTGWYWNNVHKSNALNFTYNHTVKKLDEIGGTMQARGVDYTPTFAQTNPSVSFYDSTYTNTLTTESAGVKSFSSSNTSVATVDNNGKLTLKGIGTATITLNQAAHDIYSALTASYTITVYDNFSVNIVGGDAPGTYLLSKIPFPITGATSVTLSTKNGEEWKQANIKRIQEAIKAQDNIGGSKLTLTSFDMSGIALHSDVTELRRIFQNFSVLETVELPFQGTANAINFNYIFQGCTALSTITNFEKYTNITSLNHTFDGCVSLDEIYLSTNPNNISTLTSTFDNINAGCIVYLPAGVNTVPSAWQGYDKLFAVSFAINDITPFEFKKIGEILSLYDPVMNPSYAAYKNCGWQIKKSDAGSSWATLADNTTLDISYDNALLRIAAQRYERNNPNSTIYYSNEIELIVKDRISPEENTTIHYDIFEEIFVNPNVTLTVADNPQTDRLIIKATPDAYFNIDDASNLRTKELYFHKSIDRTYTYFFSVPFDCTLADIIAANPHLGAYPDSESSTSFNWAIIRYDENLRATSGVMDGRSWRLVLPTETLKANIGYTATLNSATPLDMIIPITYSSYTSLSEGGDVSVTATPSGVEAIHIGWNLISVPYYTKGHYKLSFSDCADMFVNIPNNHATNGYTQCRSSKYVFSPTESFFVQIPTSGTISFTKIDSLSNIAPKNNGGNSISISVSDSTGLCDISEVLFNANAPLNEYYTLYDLEKMTSFARSARVYVNDHNVRLAYSSINPDDYSEVALGVYAPCAGQFTLELRDDTPNNYDIYLYDALNEQEIYADSYTFTAAGKGFIDDRFSIRIDRKIATGTDYVEKSWSAIANNDGGISIAGLNQGESKKLFTADGKLIHSYVSKDSQYTISNLPPAVYMLAVGSKTTKLIIR